jgi:hypothetical protein
MSLGRLLVAISMLAFTAIRSAQDERGSVTGTLSDPDGAAVGGLPIQLKNKETGAVARTRSAANGRYTFAQLAAGTYELSIATPCCTFERFVRDDITLGTGQVLQLEIRLKEGVSLNTASDDPATLAAVVRKRSSVGTAPVPRTPDGRPDLSGMWLKNEDPYPEPAAALPWAAALAKERVENKLKDAPHVRCLPGSPPVPAAAPPFMVKFVQTPTLLVMLFEDAPGFRQVFLDGRPHPADPDPTWLGHAVGRWEGDTLVVDTVGYNDRSWIGVYPHTERMHLTERYRRSDLGHLDVNVTIEDPGTFSKPWRTNATWELAPKEELIEYVCENNKPEHMVGK